MSESDGPRNVVAALARVMVEVGGIEKETPEQRRRRGGSGGDQGVQYAYRGIDQIASAVQPLFGKHGVVLAPRVVHRAIHEVTINGKPWTDTLLEVEWTIYGPGGIEDKILACTHGWGRDNSDKGINKATTSAYKNLLLRLLSIGDPQDDTDKDTHVADDIPTAPPVELVGARAAGVELVAAFEGDVGAAKELWATGGTGTRPIARPDLDALLKEARALMAATRAAGGDKLYVPSDQIDDTADAAWTAEAAKK